MGDALSAHMHVGLKLTRIALNGETLNISFAEGVKAAKWDIKIVWVDEGAPVVWMNCKLSEISKFIMHYNRDTDETTADTE
jgi:hypothetical protein